MKYRKAIAVILFVVLVVGLFCILFARRKDYKIITLDINPSFEIRLLEDQIIKEVIANNQDAKDLMQDNFHGKELNDFFKALAEKLIGSSYVEDDSVFVLSYIDDEYDREVVRNQFQYYFGDTGINLNFYYIEKITKEDKSLAAKYKISPTKAAYLNQTLKKHKDLSIDSILDKPIKEIVQTEETGRYCEGGSILEGTFCLKEIHREAAKQGMVCPKNADLYQDKCYMNGKILNKDTFLCPDGFGETEDGKCKNIIRERAEGICEEGDYFSEQDVCVVRESVGDAVEICRITPESDMLMDHKCYGPKPMINGGCLNGDSIVNGWCIDFNSYYESDWKCPDGFLRSNSEIERDGGDTRCYNRKEVPVAKYKCQRKEQKLEGNMCITEIIREKEPEHYCEEGYTLIDGVHCYDLSHTVDFVSGYVCDGVDTRLRGNMCVQYEFEEART